MAEPRFVRADEPLQIAEGETYTIAGQPLAIDYTAILGDATISSVGTAVVSPSGQLAVDAKQANAATYTNADGDTVAIGKAVLLAVSGQLADQQYVIRVPVTTSDSEVRVGEAYVVVQ